MFSRRIGQSWDALLRKVPYLSRPRHWVSGWLVVALMVSLGVIAAQANRHLPNTESTAAPQLQPTQNATHSLSFRSAALFDVSAIPVSTISAASFESVPVAPDAIVAAFGGQLATQTVVATDADPNQAGIQLPTTLGGTTIEVNGRKAGLFFVSPGQINFVMPSLTESGMANIVVKASDGTTSNGSLSVSQVAPAIFTANANGRGVPSAIVQRFKASGQFMNEPVSQFSSAANRFITRPIDLSVATDRVFLVLFLSGLRRANDPNGDRNLNESFRVLIGGLEVQPSYVGEAPGFVGLDQVNVEIPRELSGRGIVNVSVTGIGYNSSNLVDIEIAGSGGGNNPPQVSSFSSAALAGQELLITGTGFSAIATENIVKIGNLSAEVMQASATQLRVMVPFGVESNTVSVQTAQGLGVSASILPVRTSISGLVENTSRQPLSGVTVKVVDKLDASRTLATATTSNDGLFVVPDLAPDFHSVVVDGESLQTNPPYPQISLKINTIANRDNPFSRPISLQQATGVSGNVGTGTAFTGEETSENSGAEQSAVAQPPTQGSLRLSLNGFQLDVPAGSKAVFPNGEKSGKIYLTQLQNARTPVELPYGYYSNNIVQITPFNVSIDPGAKMVFPNAERFPAGSTVTLFRYDFDAGKFVQEKETAKVSDDGARIETGPNAIKITSYYFATLQAQSTTTITGRVVDRKGNAVRAQARYRGQEAYTDGNGSYVLRFVPVSNTDNVTVEITVQRSGDYIERIQSASVPVVQGGITKIPDVVVSDEKRNRPPTIIAPPKLELTAGQRVEVKILLTDPDPGQTLGLEVSGAAFASINRPNVISSASYTLVLAPTATQAGEYTLVLKATDNLGGEAKHEIAIVVTKAKE